MHMAHAQKAKWLSGKTKEALLTMKRGTLHAQSGFWANAKIHFANTGAASYIHDTDIYMQLHTHTTLICACTHKRKAYTYIYDKYTHTNADTLTTLTCIFIKR